MQLLKLSEKYEAITCKETLLYFMFAEAFIHYCTSPHWAMVMHAEKKQQQEWQRHCYMAIYIVLIVEKAMMLSNVQTLLKDFRIPLEASLWASGWRYSKKKSYKSGNITQEISPTSCKR